MKVQQPSLWTLGLGALDLSRRNVKDVQRLFRDYHPLPFKVAVGSVILAAGTIVVATDLARWYPLRAWWFGELARRGEEMQRQIQDEPHLEQAQMRSKEAGHDLAH